MSHDLRHRTNMVHREAEDWRPPLFDPPTTPRARLVAALRQFFDLQAGSVWRDVAAVLPSVRGAMVDVGCGAQPYRPLVHPGVRYRGIDTDAARAHFGYEIPDTEYFAGDVWPLADASVNFVLATETLEHVFDTGRFVGEAARCLEPGGTLMMTVPFAARWHFIPHDFWRFTPSSLERILAAHGFVEVRVYARGNALTVACYKAMALVLRLLMPQGAGTVAGALLRALGLALVPAFVGLAVIANLSLRGRGGDDCLGYTVLASRATATAARTGTRSP
ncbi:MAG TPA: class I SAM-dependent methyltransferase [Polyangiaceae bacterium]|nr:class I SAM-dependent methyltransferase [Polyangiaceae bacterium]